MIGRRAFTAGLLGTAACADRIVVAHLTPDAAAEDGAPETSRTDVSLSQGLQGSYYDNIKLEGTPVLERVDASLELTWIGKPTPAVPEMFSARWLSQLEVPTSDSYTLRMEADDGCRLWLNETLVLDAWKGAPTDVSAVVPLDAGRHNLRAELFSYGGAANLYLSWARPGQQTQHIPRNRYYLP